MEKYMMKAYDGVKTGYVCTIIFAEEDYQKYLSEGYVEVTREKALEKARQENIISKYLGVITK
jgi:hypothetical protein